MATKTPTHYFTPEEIAELRDGLTMLDIYRARKSATKDDVGLEAYHHAALRLGLVPEATNLEEFLGRIRAVDFGAVTNAPTPLVSGGKNGRGSSASTDTPPENSSS